MAKRLSVSTHKKHRIKPRVGMAPRVGGTNVANAASKSKAGRRRVTTVVVSSTALMLTNRLSSTTKINPLEPKEGDNTH